MKRFTLLLILLLPTLANAQVVGFVNADGYTWNGSHWVWSDGSLWSRSWVTGYGYHSGGYYQYSRYYAPANVTVNVEKVDEFGILAKAVAARAAVEGKVLLNQQFIDAAKQLGFVNSGIYTGTGSALYGTFGTNTSTIYGYNQLSLAQVTNPFDPGLAQLLLAHDQTTKEAVAAGDRAHDRMNATVNNVVNQSALLNGINARVAALERLGKLVDGPPVSINTQTQFKLENGKLVPELLPQSAKAASVRIPDDLLTRWGNSASRCVSCHSGGKTDGGFDVTLFHKLAPEKQANAIARLVLPKSDPKHMPKGADPISPGELKAWVEIMSIPADRK